MKTALWKFVIIVGVTLCLHGCSPTPRIIPTPTVEPTASPTPFPHTPIFTITPTAAPLSATPTRTLTSTPTPEICSPLQGIPLTALSDLIVNKYAPPQPSSDDPHQGVDFAITNSNTQIAVSGHPVEVVLSGKVAGVIQDRFPYGNAVLIETSMQQLPDQWLREIPVPTPAPILVGHPILTCPEQDIFASINANDRSLYLMYAHLKDAPNLQIGDMVVCGQGIGEIGDSGNALNPHLHVEVRVGPSGAVFESMAHYDAGATPLEMATYCQWRVSNQFQRIDPMGILFLQP